jgi:rod shape determining protein RodA
MAVLGLVLIFGHTSHGNKSWMDVGGFRFQPSELMKVVVIIALSKYYSENDREQLDLHDLFIGGLIVLAPMLLVIFQGDLGTAVTFLPIYIGLSFLAGIKKRHIVALLLAAAISAPLGWLMLKDYQRGRIQTVLNPSNDPRHLGYQTIQSKIAIGSGRFLGKGFKQGSQGQLGFLPARHTDFIFAVLAEERGFVGSMALLLLLLFVSLRREGQDRHHDHRRRPLSVSLSHLYQRRDGGRTAAHCRDPAAAAERGRVFADFFLRGHGIVHEHQHAPVRQLRSLPEPTEVRSCRGCIW